MFLANNWKDYEVMDAGDGEKLERWGDICLRRPDPQVIWPMQNPPLWQNAHAHYHRSEHGGGQWEFFKPLPERWNIAYDTLRFYVRPTGFKHTGLFPEQAVNWDWMRSLIAPVVQRGHLPKILNLFGYTGGATLACAQAGAEVVHIDAAKGMLSWGRENANLSSLSQKPIRWIVEDALRFVKREAKRGNHYHGILMDPPSYGRGPGGEVWKLEDELFGLVKSCEQILAPQPLFFLLNGYTTGLQAAVLSQILSITLKDFGGRVSSGELGLPITTGGVLPCGASGRWQS